MHLIQFNHFPSDYFWSYAEAAAAAAAVVVVVVVVAAAAITS
jgi:hypothetical protein